MALTPLANSLANLGEEEAPSIASYLVASDSHSIANNNQTFLEGAAETASNVTKFIGASMVSGANQIYNIAPTLGNMLGGEFEQADVDDWMQSVDDDLGKYYEEHKQSIDVGGFFVSSLIPGMAGIKVLNAGQKMLQGAITSGKVGGNMGKAVGLLAPSRQKHLNSAIKDIVNKNSTFKLTETNVLRAMGAGLGQGVLEAAAFEVAVAATLNQSPVLKDQDLSDFASNILIGGLAFGAIGGVISGAQSTFAIKRAVKAADVEAKPWTEITDLVGKPDTAHKIIHDYDQLRTMPEIPAHIKDDRLAFVSAQARKKQDTLLLRIRSNIRELAGGDRKVAKQVYDLMKTADLDTAMHTFMGAKEITRMAVKSTVEKEASRITKRAAKGKGSLDDAERLGDLRTTYAKLWGEEMGNVTATAPKVLSLADNLKPGQKIEVSANGVKVGKVQYKNSIKASPELAKVTPVTAQARHAWAQKLAPFKGKEVIHEDDIPLLEKMWREFNDVPEELQIKFDSGITSSMPNKDAMFNFLVKKKEEVANKLNFQHKGAMTQEEIASITNVRNSYLSGNVKRSENLAHEADVFALQSYAEEYGEALIKRGVRTADDKPLEMWKVPQNAKITYDTSVVKDMDGNVLEGMAIIRQQQNLHIDDMQRVAASNLGEDYTKLVEITDKDILNANRLGAGPGFATAASSNYGSLGAKMEFLGNQVTGMIEKGRNAARETLEPLLVKLAQSQDATIEWSVLNNRLRSIPDSYVLNDAGDALVPAVIKRFEDLLAEGKTPKQPKLKADDAPLEIPLKSKEVRELAAAHIEVNGAAVEKMRMLRSTQGMEYTNHSNTFYPTPVDPKDYPFFALVTDESITSTGRTKMLFANSEEQLQQQITKLTGGNATLKVRTKKEAEDYWKAVGQFEFEKTINDNYLDAAAHRKGVSSPYLVPTDASKVTNELLQWHMKNQAGVVRETVAGVYESQFQTLRNLGEAFTNAATSRTGSLSLLKHADEVVENPFMDYVKTALGVRNYSDYPFWTSANRLVDSKMSQMYGRVAAAFKGARSPKDMAAVNKALQEHGYKGPSYDEGMELLANHTAPKGALTNFIHRGNAILATTMLRLDTLNAVNNTVGAQVLLGSETKAVLRALERADENALGELAKLTQIKVPGTDKTMFSAKKLIASAVAKFGRDAPEMQFYRDHRFITTITDQYKSIVDDLTLQGAESVNKLDTKLKSAFDKAKKFSDLGEKVTGNRLAEEFNRFVAADVMKQITDVGVKAGVISGKEQLAYINTFINRTQGNYLAAQRPMLFQGPIGQAVGLFQTYQFNLMQQLLRHVGEGTAKDSMTLLGLQGTIYGMNGLPAFNAINTHIIGTASGNDKHKDLYDVAYGAAGKNAGDWLMYGVASNMLLDPELKTNLYVRGDINPRHVTLIPTNPADVAIVGASTKFFSNIFRTADTLIEGGDVSQTLLTGLEQNGISRPLAGLAQTLRGLDNPEYQSYSTSRRGNVIASNDILSWANMTRIIGGKPLAEAVAVDSAFRFKAYQAKDWSNRQDLGKAVKSTLIAGGNPSQEEIEGFAQRYVEIGGKQNEFNKWMLQQYKTANTSQVNELQRNLDSPFSQSMQQIMGGYQLNDFTN